MKDYNVQNGILSKVTKQVKEIKNVLSLRKIFREILTWLHVPFSDECCPEASDSQPVRVNNDNLET